MTSDGTRLLVQSGFPDAQAERVLNVDERLAIFDCDGVFFISDARVVVFRARLSFLFLLFLFLLTLRGSSTFATVSAVPSTSVIDWVFVVSFVILAKHAFAVPE
jgi:hypothetical protein